MNKNIIGNVKAKHGTFYFCHFDEYIGLSIREYGEYSELELKTILEFINEGDTVFDIGANIGYFLYHLQRKLVQMEWYMLSNFNRLLINY